MGFVDAAATGTVGAVSLWGVLLIVAGLYVQRSGRLRIRQGAAVLASFAALIGIVVVGVGAIVFFRGA
jgi:hypothetical protein